MYSILLLFWELLLWSGAFGKKDVDDFEEAVWDELGGVESYDLEEVDCIDLVVVLKVVIILSSFCFGWRFVSVINSVCVAIYIKDLWGDFDSAAAYDISTLGDRNSIIFLASGYEIFG